MHQDDLAAMNIDLTGLMNSGSIELHYSEFGVGGGSRDTGASLGTRTGWACPGWSHWVVAGVPPSAVLQAPG
jgi:hypothetical protein